MMLCTVKLRVDLLEAALHFIVKLTSGPVLGLGSGLHWERLFNAGKLV